MASANHPFAQSFPGVDSQCLLTRAVSPRRGSTVRVQGSALGVFSACLQVSVPFLGHSGHPNFSSLESIWDLGDPHWNRDEQKKYIPAIFNTRCHTCMYMYRCLLYTPAHRPVHVDRCGHPETCSPAQRRARARTQSIDSSSQFLL